MNTNTIAFEQVNVTETKAAGDQRTRVRTVLATAFATDPAARWTFRDDRTFLRQFESFIDAFAGAAFDQHTMDVAPDFSGAALWLPPGHGPDEEAVGQVMTTALPSDRLGDVFQLMEQMGAFRPREPHWYLPLIGVLPRRQGCGVGSSLLRHGVARCDRDGLPAYLESTNPRNLPLYERFGFRALGEIRVADSPPIVPMLRQPREIVWLAG